MSELKCPIHDTELAYLDEGVYGHTGCGMTGNKKLWEELIRTRKALEIAKDTLHWYDDNYDSVVAMETLKEITTLEQKDEK